MTKEEKIKRAWNKLLPFKPKGGYSLIDGYSNELYHEVQDDIDYNFFDYEKVTIYNGRIRPKSLQGIENNNMWIRIENEDDLPKEELVTFETAKLAKEKGFNIPTWDYFCPQGEQCNPERQDWNNLNEPYSHTSRPTQSLLQRWLREVHNFHITICNTNPGDKVDFKFSMSELYKSDNDDSKKYIILGSKGSFKTYEDALEIGLQESLKLIKTSHLL